MTETPDVPVEDTVAMQVRSRLRELTLPLRAQLEEIDKRLVIVTRERDDLAEARRELRKMIDKLEPSLAKASGARVNGEIGYIKKKKAVEKFIAAHKELLKDGFTATDLNRLLKADGQAPVMSPAVTLKIVREMHASGILRADHIGKGGAQYYVVVGK